MYSLNARLVMESAAPSAWVVKILSLFWSHLSWKAQFFQVKLSVGPFMVGGLVFEQY